MLLEAQELARHYATPAGPVRALDGVSLEIADGDAIALVGPSGCGKSTLLNVLGGLDRPTGGRLFVRGRDVARLDTHALAAYRRHDVGIVFQSFNLISHRSALDNVTLPLLLAGVDKTERERRGRELLAAVSLSARAGHRPAELSGGEQQRVAIARALANDPALILADEPTGNLDSATAAEILDLLLVLHDERGRTLVIVTHDEQVAARASRRVRLRDGKVVEGS